MRLAPPHTTAPFPRQRVCTAICTVAAVALGACGGGSADSSATVPSANLQAPSHIRTAAAALAPLTLSSPAFAEQGTIPDAFTFSYGGQCNGSNWSPPLEFGGVPSDTQSLALVVQDPDGGNWMHWKAWNIPAGTRSLAVDAARSALFAQAINDFGAPGYGGPCPPTPSHRYVFTLYALSKTFSGEPSLNELAASALATATLTGRRSPTDRLAWTAPAVSPQTGWWWNRSQPGTGFAIERQGNRIFLASFSYEDNGRSTWYASTLDQQANAHYTADLLKYSGGQTLGGNYQAPLAPATEGTADLFFDTATSGRLLIKQAGGLLQRTVLLERFPISTPTTFTPSMAGGENGWWWNPAEGGRGFFVETQGQQAFTASFMYNEAGQPVWYASAAPLAQANSFSSNLLVYTQGQTLYGGYREAQLQPATPGALAFSFSSATQGTMTLPNGRAVAMQRFRF